MEPTWLTDEDSETGKAERGAAAQSGSSSIPPLHLSPPSAVPVGTRLQLAEEIRTKEKERRPGPAHALSI